MSTKLSQREQEAVAALFARLVHAAGASRSFLYPASAHRRDTEWTYVDRSLTRC